MPHFEIIKCHGSGNDFIMVDAIAESPARSIDREAFARAACDRKTGIGGDGILFVERDGDGICVMDMLNPDGTHAEMCGNGIRCVARLAYERGYIVGDILRSGGRDYRVARGENMADGISAYKVDMALRLWSDDFSFFDAEHPLLNGIVEPLDGELRFTALVPGNPHIVAAVSHIDIDRLQLLGERVKGLGELFPNGVNISLYECRSRRELFVATYERGAGITLSCGTAMTSSATAAVLLGLCDEEERIEVRNRGGKVFCRTRIDEGRPVTTLEGNATYVWCGKAIFDDGRLSWQVEHDTGEQERWHRFVESMK